MGVRQSVADVVARVRPERRRRWPWVAIALAGALAVLATVLFVGGGIGSDASRVADAAAVLAGRPAVALKGTITDERGARTAVAITVAADGRAQGTLTREFGASAEIVSDGVQTLLRANDRWWLWSYPGVAADFVDRWQVNPPAFVTGLVDPGALTPGALAARLQENPGRWDEVGVQNVDGRSGAELYDGDRLVIVATGSAPQLLDMPLVVPSPRSYVPGPSQMQPEPPSNLANLSLSIAEPSGNDLQQLERAVEKATQSAETTRPTDWSAIDRMLDGSGSYASYLGEVRHRLEKGNLSPEQSLDAVRSAVKGGFFAPLYQLATSGRLHISDDLPKFLREIINGQKLDLGKRAQVEWAARESLRTLGGKPLWNLISVDIPVQSPGGLYQADILLLNPAASGLPSVAIQMKSPRVNSGITDVREAVRQLNEGVERVPPGANRVVWLDLTHGAEASTRVAGQDKLLDYLNELDLEKDWNFVDANGSPRIDGLLITNQAGRFEFEVDGGKVVPAKNPLFGPFSVPGSGGSGPGGAPRPPWPGSQAGGAAELPLPEPDEEQSAEAPPACLYDPNEAVQVCPRTEEEKRRQEMERRLFDVPDRDESAQGPLIDALSQPVDAPGGIDFSSLSLRYLSDGSGGAPTRYAFSANPADGTAGPASDGAASAVRGSDAFFVWLTLPRDAFWVNLNPTQPDRITDAKLGTTDVGRILLEADLQLKKGLAHLKEPGTPAGDRFWRAPGALDTVGYCGGIRVWIVPGEAQIREVNDAVYVEQAPLVVRTERSDVARAPGCTPPPPGGAERYEGLVKSIALPELQRQVNEAPEYAQLRQVYYARVAAEWYRERSKTHQTEFANLVDRGDVAPWKSVATWSPQEVFDRYRQSFENGEYPLKEVGVRGDQILSVTSGGIDLTAVTLKRDTKVDGAADAVVDASFDEPSDDDAGRIWLGATTDVPLPEAAPVGPESGLPWTSLAVGLVAVLAVGSAFWWFRRRQAVPVAASTVAASPEPVDADSGWGSRPRGGDDGWIEAGWGRSGDGGRDNASRTDSGWDTVSGGSGWDDTGTSGSARTDPATGSGWNDSAWDGGSSNKDDPWGRSGDRNWS